MESKTGERLASLRRSKGLSQEELAARLGLTRQAISNWERAESAPDTDNLIALARLYDVSIDALLFDTDVGIADATAATAVSSYVAVTEQRPAAPGAVPIAFAIAAVASGLYYLFAAQPLALTTVDDIASVFGLQPSPTLAIVWFVVEVVLMLLPYAAVAAAVRVFGQEGRFAWVSPFAAWVALVLAFNATAFLAGVPLNEYTGIGGALVSSVVVKADLLGIAAGCALVAWAAARASRRTGAST